MRPWLGILAGVLASAVAALAPAFGQELPAIKLVTAPMLSPTQAWTSYQPSTQTTHTFGVAEWREGGVVTTPPEIRALARSLGADRIALGELTQNQYAQAVYEYVRNNIAVEFRFGLAKGGRGALIAQSGTPFDQADLMVLLLREGGLTANYQVGTVTLNAQQFGVWSGLITNLNEGAQTFTVNAQAACQLLADGGIPAVVNGVSSCSPSPQLSAPLSSVVMGHVWVSANGLLYDPSYKRHRLRAGIDIAAAAGCGTAASPTCGTLTTTAAMTGATLGTIGPASAPTIEGVNNTAVTTQLNTLASNVQTYIENNLPTGQIENVLGGTTVDASYNPTIAASLPYTSSAQATWTGRVPDQFRTTLTVTWGNVSQLFYSDEISGQRIRLYVDNTAAGQFTRRLVAEDTIVASAVCDPCAVAVTLAANHPYLAGGGTYADETTTSPQTVDLAAIVQSWGPSTESSLRWHSDRTAIDPSPFRGVPGAYHVSCNSPDTVRCDDRGYATIGATFLTEENIVTSRVLRIAGAAGTSHHSIGLVTTSVTHPMFSTKIHVQSTLSIQAPSNSATVRSRAFETVAATSALIEGSIGQRNQDSFQPLFAASVAVENAAFPGNRFVDVSSANLAATLPALNGYGSRTATLTAAAADGYNFVLPQNANSISISNGFWQGSWILAYRADRIGYLLDDAYKGASLPTAPDPANAALRTAQNTTARSPVRPSVDLATGSITMTADPDLITGAGDFPYSLPFQRTYMPGAAERRVFQATTPYFGPDADSFGRIGGGWVHNYQITARIGSSVAEAMGADSAVDASAAIAGLFTLYDLSSSMTFQRRTASLFVDYWISNQLVGNTVSIQLGPQQLQFQRLPNGRFNPPPGSGLVLTQSGTRTTGGSVVDGNQRWDYAPVGLNLIHTDGSVVAFNTGGRWVLTVGGVDAWVGEPFFKAVTWTFPDGMVVTFNYGEYGPAGCVTTPACQTLFPCGFTPNCNWPIRYYLTSVTNSFGRSLTFTSQEQFPGNPSCNTQSGQNCRGYSLNGMALTSVTDENGRAVAFSRNTCPMTLANNGGGTSTGFPVFFTCGQVVVNGPASSLLKYNYDGTGQPTNSALLVRPTYRLASVNTGLNPTNPIFTLTYDDVFRIRALNDILGHNTRFYPGGLFSEFWRRGYSIDPLGAVSTHIFGRSGERLQSIDPIGRVTTFAYDGANRLVLTTNPEGDALGQAYDVRSNPTLTTFYPKPCTSPGVPHLCGTAPITTSRTYPEGGARICVNPATCNSPLTSVDGRNNATNYTWNATTGQLTQILSPADSSGLRPQTDLQYSAPSGTTVSLLQQRTDRIDATRYRATTYAYDAANHYVLRSATVDPAGLNLRTCFEYDAGGNLTGVTDPRGTTGGCP